jgi:hypothetical protein
MTQRTEARRARTARPESQATARSAIFRRLSTGAAVIGVEGAAGYLHPAVGTALAATDIIVPAAVALILLAAILCGSTQTCERVFRLLRWIADRPEPPAPATTHPRNPPSG